jgi:AcrR family transcriptional regulator
MQDYPEIQQLQKNVESSHIGHDLNREFKKALQGASLEEFELGPASPLFDQHVPDQSEQPIRPRKRPSQKRSVQTVAAILKASAQILEDEGLGSLNTNYIAKKSGVSIGSLYQYFPNKESILVALIEKQHEKRIGILQKMLEDSKDLPFEDLVHSLIKALFQIQHTGPRLERILAEVKFQMGVPRLDYVLHDGLIEMLAKIIAERHIVFSSGDLKYSLRIILYAIKAVTIDSLYDDKLQDVDKFTNELKTMALRHLNIASSVTLH